MRIYSSDNIELKITEKLSEKLFLLNIPYLLNFKYKNLELCLKKISNELH